MRRVFWVRPWVVFDILLPRRPKGLSELGRGGIVMQSGLHALRRARRMRPLSRSLRHSQLVIQTTFWSRDTYSHCFKVILDLR